MDRVLLSLHPVGSFSHPMNLNPISDIVQTHGVFILDGGLATALEADGYDLNDDLWSAKVLLENPDAVCDVHRKFLMAGADCIITATYQASFLGFQKRALSEKETSEIMRSAVRLAVDTRDVFWEGLDAPHERHRPLVAASIGPYGAYLADGSEFTGRYGIDKEGLYSFHRARWQTLANAGADLLACETIPSECEARVLLTLLNETPDTWAWLSFSCSDGAHICDGTPLCDLAVACDTVSNVAAIGVNCTSPEFICSLVAEIRRVSSKPIVVYPNSGEIYDADNKTWTSTASAIDIVEAAPEWLRSGATGIGGCCRIGPDTIAQLRQQLLPS